mmetsp:Transcript_171148/g.548577  ORF Transcript_171148/g.548577 Transcript_171148/m.548577 type:complete len:123 (+) Transcript_171148:1464-1832(+)
MQPEAVGPLRLQQKPLLPALAEVIKLFPVVRRMNSTALAGTPLDGVVLQLLSAAGSCRWPSSSPRVLSRTFEVTIRRSVCTWRTTQSSTNCHCRLAGRLLKVVRSGFFPSASSLDSGRVYRP